MNQNAPCKLCGKSAKLIKQSHIIPNFMYNGIHDNSGRMVLVPLANAEGKPWIYQTGIFEKYVLCKKCDNELLGRLEKYSSTILFGGVIKDPPIFERRSNQDGIESIFIQNIRYKDFKLFVLSILWRAHISKNKFFEKVDIEGNEPIIRKMLLNGEVPSEIEFKISIISIKNNSKNIIRLIQNPEVKKYGKNHFASFFINGFVYFINLSPENDFPLFEKVYLKETGEIEIPIIEGDLAVDFLKAYGLSDYLSSFFIDELP